MDYDFEEILKEIEKREKEEKEKEKEKGERERERRNNSTEERWPDFTGFPYF
jgi:hypothetical protein